MNSRSDRTLSITTTRSCAKSERTTQQTLHILDFIHRFRHVTTRHIQLALGHSSITTSNNRLALLCAKGLIARQYEKADRAHNQYASYYLTPEGLKLLRARNPGRRYRLARSVKTDAVIGENARARFHATADVYAHFKRHYDAHFSFYTAFELAEIEDMPDAVPDAFVCLKFPREKPRYYFVEIFGWGRSNLEQWKRLDSYFDYFDRETWQHHVGGPTPKLLAVAGGVGSHRRMRASLRRFFNRYYVPADFRVLTTKSYELDRDTKVMWRVIKDRPYVR